MGAAVADARTASPCAQGRVGWPSEKRLGRQQMLRWEGTLRSEVGGQRCDGSAQAAARSAAGGGDRQTLLGQWSLKSQPERDSLVSFITCQVLGSMEAALAWEALMGRQALGALVCAVPERPAPEAA